MAEIGRPVCPKQQIDAAISQPNPVSTTLYEVLPETKNVRVHGVAMIITWATTQPAISLIATVDGKTLQFDLATPVSGTVYMPITYPNGADNSGAFAASNLITAQTEATCLMLSGRSVQIVVRTIWATTQPTPLVCRVKWAKW